MTPLETSTPFPAWFVTGTDTGVGKTFISALLARCWLRHYSQVRYWKVFQTGLALEEGDTPTVQSLASLDSQQVVVPRWRHQAPLCPMAAEQRTPSGASDAQPPITQEALMMVNQEVRQLHRLAPVVVEGAGGLMVPLCSGITMLDWMGRLRLPVLLVARASLGTLNHTLLSLTALRQKGLEVAGVIMNGPGEERERQENRTLIEQFGSCRVLMDIPAYEAITPKVVAQEASRLHEVLFTS
ncbi:dethiobiotin synthase [Formicincola oecophyllae]|uniref:ATP-dependent dethiobiotin synthetase BioD n=1 Tax=Formicincola oecophyllae TaxID=2558361 RepID=A0A4Y6UAQ3_9PROT|nr:dethiobiotin synthase [Formicincola oecophyllae]QDH13471.1 dethiobiotin synthase [Formicincola oecophyllae]